MIVTFKCPLQGFFRRDSTNKLCKNDWVSFNFCLMIFVWIIEKLSGKNTRDNWFLFRSIEIDTITMKYFSIVAEQILDDFKWFYHDFLRKNHVGLVYDTLAFFTNLLSRQGFVIQEMPTCHLLGLHDFCVENHVRITQKSLKIIKNHQVCQLLSIS